jgi:hypothetical protein
MSQAGNSQQLCRSKPRHLHDLRRRWHLLAPRPLTVRFGTQPSLLWACRNYIPSGCECSVLRPCTKKAARLEQLVGILRYLLPCMTPLLHRQVP